MYILQSLLTKTVLSNCAFRLLYHINHYSHICYLPPCEW